MGRFLLIAVAFACSLFAADAAKIAAVENGLMHAVVIKGRPQPKQNILARMKELNVRGVSVAVIHDYKIDWAKGYGVLDDETRKPVNTETLFQAGSISKPVAVTGAMKLIEEGKLSLDEDVNVKLKSWKVLENEFTREQKVTLRRTMSHSAGLTLHGFPGYEAGAPVPTVPQLLDGLKPANTGPVRVDTVPGTLGRYSGGGTTIMQLLMTDVTGRPFPELLRDLVLSKAGMSHSTYEQPLPERLRENTASGYKGDGAPVKGKYHTYPEMAAAGLWTTASDLALFAIEVAKSREGRSNRILRQATIELMLTEQKKPFGLGFSLEQRGATKWFGHGGADEGFQADWNCSFNGDGVVVMANSDNGGLLAREIEFAVAAAYGWEHWKPEERAVMPLAPEALKAFAGDYDAPPIGRIAMKVEGDHLILSAPGRSDTELYPESGTIFFAPVGGLPPFRFQRDSAGQVTELRAGNVTGRKVK